MQINSSSSVWPKRFVPLDGGSMPAIRDAAKQSGALSASNSERKRDTVQPRCSIIKSDGEMHVHH